MTSTELSSNVTTKPWRGTRPTGVNHNAYVTTDIEATRKFYEEVIGLPLIATWTEEDEMPGRVRTYVHTLFGMADGSALAFFQWLDPDAEIMPVFQPCTTVHLALNVDLETLAGIKERLFAYGYDQQDVVEIDHGYCNSLYTRDPNSMRLEFTSDHPDMPGILAEKLPNAHADLARWLAGDHTSNNPFRDSH
jgi:glyoxylase I family protein